MTRMAAPTRPPAFATDQHELTEAPRNNALIVAAVDGSSASTAAVDAAIELGVELDAPVVFVYVRRSPAPFFGDPVYQRRLTKAMARGRQALDRALRAAKHAGVPAEGEILEGSPRPRILEFARDRAARLVVVGRGRRRLGPRVSSSVVRGAALPVVVASASLPAVSSST
jgi:nucleotide-binding universal stress UspA family protein